MNFNVNVRMKQTGVYVIALEGNLDSSTYHILEQRLEPLLVPSTRGIIFDMSQLNYISSAGVRVLFKARKALSQTGGSCAMTNLQPQIKKVFEIINALPLLRVFRNLEEADRYLDTMQKKEMEKLGKE